MKSWSFKNLPRPFNASPGSVGMEAAIELFPFFKPCPEGRGHWRYILNSVKDKDPSKITTSISKLTSNGTFNQSPGNNLDKWSLRQLTEVAVELSLIKEETATQARLARNFRNLIHPSVTIRKNQMCRRETALSSLAALENVINDLSAISPWKWILDNQCLI